MRRIWLAAGLLMVSTVVMADMYQDARNAQLPEAQNNLGIPTTVKSEGATPPNADNLTSFYTFDNTRQFQVNARPDANEFTMMQAGLAANGGVGEGHGATSICWAPYSNNQVDCNYIAYGQYGRHRFANGAGLLGEFTYEMSGPPTAQAAPLSWPKFTATNNDVTRIEAAGASWNTDIKLELWGKGKGNIQIGGGLGQVYIGDPTPWSGTGPLLAGGKLFQVSRGVEIYNDRYVKVIGGSQYGDPRIQAWSDYDDNDGSGKTRANVDLRLLGKGSGAVVFENGFGILGRFDSASDATNRVHMRFLGNNGTLGVVAVESDYVTDVPMYVLAQGKGSIILANQDDTDGGNNLATFSSRGPGSYGFGFTEQSASGIPASIGSVGGAMSLYGFRHKSICPTDPWPPVYPCTTNTISVTHPDSGTHYDNLGATTTMNFVLPATTANSIGVHYCFTRDAAQPVRVTANIADQIAIAPTNSALGGYIDTTVNFASICLETRRQGQWIAYATPDKTQWTVH